MAHWWYTLSEMDLKDLHTSSAPAHQIQVSGHSSRTTASLGGFNTVRSLPWQMMSRFPGHEQSQITGVNFSERVLLRDKGHQMESKACTILEPPESLSILIGLTDEL